MVLWNTPDMTHVRRMRRAPRLRVTSAPFFTSRFVLFSLAVICDQMGASALEMGPSSLIRWALWMDTPSVRVYV